MKIKKGDTVKILAGKDKGKTGQVVAVLLEKQRVIVEGVNVVVKHSKTQGREKPGGRIKKPSSVHVSNVMYVDPATAKPTRIIIKREKGKKVRVSVKSGKAVKEIVEEKASKSKKTEKKTKTKKSAKAKKK